jgi:hypothetical protein
MPSDDGPRVRGVPEVHVTSKWGAPRRRRLETQNEHAKCAGPRWTGRDRSTGACSLREATTRAIITSRHSSRPLLPIAARLRRRGLGWPRAEERDAPEGDARKSRDSERREPWTEPKLEHGHVVTGAPLEDPQGATLGGQKGDAFSNQHCGRGSKPGIASSGDRASPEIAETGKLTDPDRVMEPSQGAGLGA